MAKQKRLLSVDLGNSGDTEALPIGTVVEHRDMFMTILEIRPNGYLIAGVEVNPDGSLGVHCVECPDEEEDSGEFRTMTAEKLRRKYSNYGYKVRQVARYDVTAIMALPKGFINNQQYTLDKVKKELDSFPTDPEGMMLDTYKNVYPIGALVVLSGRWSDDDNEDSEDGPSCDQVYYVREVKITYDGTPRYTLELIRKHGDRWLPRVYGSDCDREEDQRQIDHRYLEAYVPDTNETAKKKKKAKKAKR
jgi:hypothetical protein